MLGKIETNELTKGNYRSWIQLIIEKNRQIINPSFDELRFFTEQVWHGWPH